MILTALRWLTKVPAAVRHMTEDVATAKHNDPAARGTVETALLNPGLHAIWVHHVAHDLHVHGATFTARAISHASRFFTGVEIHPGAKLGRRVFIDHGMGIVIGETAKVGDDCLLYTGVVLGGVSLNRTVRHPQLGRGVVVGSNTCVLGAISIGDHARVGSGSVIVRPVPANATVVGVPARMVVSRDQRLDAALDHANLPDPVSNAVRWLGVQHARLDARLTRLESRVGIAPAPISRG